MSLWDLLGGNLHLRKLVRQSSSLKELEGEVVLQPELVFVSIVRNVDRGAARADPVGTHWTGVPSSKPGQHLLLLTCGFGCAVDVG